MPRFGYTAIDSARKSVRGTVTAESAFAARRHLRSKGMHPTDIKELTTGDRKKSLMSILNRTNKAQVTEFTRELSTMLNAGIKLTEALSVLIRQINDTRLRNAVSDIRDRVVTGESLADSMEEYEQYFDVIYISMVRVGEVTGTLADSLCSIADFMEKRHRLESKMATVMIYPIILVIACLAAVLFLTIKVIPVIAEQIEKTGQELPMITRVLLWFSDVMTGWGLFVFIGIIVGLIWGYRVFVSTQKGAYLRDKFLLSIPVFGPLLRQRIVARFASTLSTLLGSGLSMAESLKIVAEVTGNTIMNRAVKQARDRILSGADIATPLRDSGVIDPAIAHMVTVGEKSGELEMMLMTISKNLESGSDVVIERLSAAMEPVIIVIMAMIVGVIAYGTLLPIIKFSAGQF